MMVTLAACGQPAQQPTAAATTAAATTAAATTTAAAATTTAETTTAAPPAPETTKAQSLGQVQTAAPVAQASVTNFDTPMSFTVVRRITETVDVKDDIYAAEMLDRFNVTFDVDEINAIDYLTKAQLRFAIGDVADFIAPVRPEWGFNDWIRDGFVKSFTEDEIKTYIPDYIPMWGDERWPTVKAITTWGDGLIYSFHGKRANISNQAWMFRGKYMDEYALDFPETTDELADLMRHFKEHTGFIPWVWQMQNDPLNAIVGVMMPFFMPELAQREYSHYDMRTGEFIPFAFSTDNWRDALIWLNQLHTEGLLWTEFTTATAEMRNALWTQGHGFTMWGWISEILHTYNPMTKQYDPDDYWVWSPYMVSADQSKGAFYKRDPYHNADGFAFGAHMEGDKLLRLGAFVSWLCTEEGEIFTTYGLENEHWNFNADGIPVHAPFMNSPDNPSGTKLSELGFFFSVSGYGPRSYYYYPDIAKLEEQVVYSGKYYFFPQLRMIFNEEETRRLADITTPFRDAAGEYCARFVMGQLDPNNDAHWDEYLGNLDRIGLAEFEAIRTDTFYRGNQHILDLYGDARNN